MNVGWRKWGWLVLFCYGASMGMARAETVRIAVGDWPPYIGESLPNQGFLSQVVREAFAESGMDVSFHFYPWSKAYQLAQHGTYIVTMPWFRSAERERDFYLSVSLGHFTTRLFSLNGTPIKHLAHLKGEAVGVTRGYFYGDGFAARQLALTLDWSDSDEESMEKLITGRIRYLVMDEQVANALFKQHQKTHQVTATLVGAPDPVWSQPAYMLVRKSEPDARRFMTLFNGGLLKLRRSGRLDELWKQ